jgi:outer membrane protein assembly factor BamE (lipoprotein component of BamABCDE complex)
MPVRATRLVVPALMLAAAGCSTIPNNQGYIVDTDLIESVQPGVDTKGSIAKSLGRPTEVSMWDDNVWYYISRNTGQRAFFRPVPTGQNILIVTFGEDDVVKSVERRGLENVVSVDPSNKRTPTLGKEQSLIEDIFGNIGQVGGVGAGPGGAGGPPQ